MKTSSTLWIWEKAERTTRLLRGMEGSLKTKITNRVDLYNNDIENEMGSCARMEIFWRTIFPSKFDVTTENERITKKKKNSSAGRPFQTLLPTAILSSHPNILQPRCCSAEEIPSGKKEGKTPRWKTLRENDGDGRP